MSYFCNTKVICDSQLSHLHDEILKKLKHIISWTIWSLLALYVLLIVLIHVPSIQSWIGQQVADAISQKLNTEVSVGRVDLGFFNRLIIDDVVVHDQASEKLLHARRMAVKMELMPLLNGRFNISSAQLLGTQVRLYRDSANAVPNYQFVIDALSSPKKDEPSRMNLHVGSLIVRNLSVSYDQNDAPLTPGRFNTRHLKLSDVSAHVLLRTMTPDTLNINVKRLSLNEQSGLALNHLTFKLEGNRRGAQLTGFNLKLPHSNLAIDSLSATYLPDQIPTSVQYAVPHLTATIALSDFASLLPEHFPVHHSFNIDTSIGGTFDGFDCQHLHINSPDDFLTLNASARLSNEGEWDADIDHLSASERLFTELHELYPTLPSFLQHVGVFQLSGLLRGTGEDVSAMGNIHTGIGSLAWKGTTNVDGTLWSAHVDTDSLDIQRLTEQANLGLLTAKLDLSASNGVITIQGDVPRVDFKGYSYHNLTLDGVYSPARIAGKLNIDDPYLQADVEGSFENDDVPHIRLTGFIGSIAPQALHLADRWGAATFSTVVDADFTATSLADAQGTIDLDDFIMVQSDTARYHLDNLHIRSGYSDERHYLRLNSDFGEMLLSGQYNFNTLPQSFATLIPMLKDQIKSDANHENNFNISMQLTDSHWMQQLLGIGLDLEGPLSLEADINDVEQQISMKAAVPSFSYGTGRYRQVNLLFNTMGDSAQCILNVTRLTAKGAPLYLKLDAQANKEQLQSTLSMSNDGTDGGTIHTVTRIYNNDNGQQEVHMRVLPSHFVMKGSSWELEPCDILYSEKRLMIDGFTLHHDDEHIIIDGIASTQASDSLLVDLRGLDVAYILDLVNFSSVKFDGRATGQAYVTHAFSTPDAWADLTVDEFLFQGAPMGTLEAHAAWDADEGQINLDAAIDDGADAQTFVDGFVSPLRKEIDLGIRARGTSIGFVHSFTKSFLSRVEGHCHGDVRVHGPLSHINLTGEASVNGQVSVSPLGTSYTFHDNVVTLSPGVIALNDFKAYDRDQHQAVLNGTINHHYLKNFTFDMEVDAVNLLAYDFPQMEAGSTIGGTIWANGQAVMRGRPGEVVINCDVSPAPGSVFIYNAANPDAINRQQFITFTSKEESARLVQQTDASPLSATPYSPRSQSGDLRMNLRINANPNATLRLLMDQHSGDQITLNGTGVLRASYYNKGPFQMFGTYNVERGTYSMTIQNIIKKNFQFQDGSSLVFGGDPLQAALNLKAQHTVNGVTLTDLGLGNSFTNNTIRVNCLMNILGTAGEPRVEFDLEMPTVNSEEQQMIRSIIASEQELNQQVVYLLGIGRFYTQGANNASTQSYGQTELAMQSLLSGTVSSQINQLLSQVIKNDDWNFGANISTGNEGWHNAEYEGLVSGRMLNNRLLINGQFGYRDNATSATPSFIGDFDIQYILTPGGSLALKAYNQTNDRYFTHSSLNTQGIGIIMKKDFNGLQDLFTHRRKKQK